MKFLCFIPSRLWLKDFEFWLFGPSSHISDSNTNSCDLPYFHIGGRRHFSPGFIGMVAKLVADIREET